jgi:hypothetical protein
MATSMPNVRLDFLATVESYVSYYDSYLTASVDCGEVRNFISKHVDPTQESIQSTVQRGLFTLMSLSTDWVQCSSVSVRRVPRLRNQQFASSVDKSTIMGGWLCFLVVISRAPLQAARYRTVNDVIGAVNTWTHCYAKFKVGPTVCRQPYRFPRQLETIRGGRKLKVELEKVCRYARLMVFFLIIELN